MTTSLKTLLEHKRRPLMLSLHTPGMLLTETVGQLDIDAVMIDMQHGALDYAGTYAMLTALGASPAAPLVRVPWNDAATVMRVLDAGAHGVICPMLETAEAARELVAACRYPPEGMRSIGPNRAAFTEDYLATANREILAIALVETRLGYENIDAIAATEGLDAIMVGSGDLTASMDGKLRMDPADPVVIERMQRMIDSAHAHGLWAVCAASGGGARDQWEAGADLLVFSDNSILKGALKRTLASLREQVANAA